MVSLQSIVGFRRSGVIVLAAACILAIVSAGQGKETERTASAPVVTISQVPPAAKGGPGDTFPIGGTVQGLQPSEHSRYKVVIYARAGEKWWCSPSPMLH